MSNEIIRALLKSNSDNAINVVINNKFICEFVVPKLADNEVYYFFSEFVKDKNCPRYSCYADVKVYENDNIQNGKIIINHDTDLGINGIYNITLGIYNENSLCTLINVIDCNVKNKEKYDKRS